MRIVTIENTVYKINPTLSTFVQLEENFGSPLDFILFEKEFLEEDFHRLNGIVVANYQPFENESTQDIFNTLVLGEIFIAMGLFKESLKEQEEEEQEVVETEPTWVSNITNDLFLKVLRYADMSKNEFLDLTFNDVDKLLEEFQRQQRDEFTLMQVAFTNVMGSMYSKDYEMFDPFDFLDEEVQLSKEELGQHNKNEFAKLKKQFEEGDK